MQPSMRQASGQSITVFSLDELMRTTQRLNAIMLEEGGLLKGMQIKELTRFQDEKNQLLNVLETYQQRMAADPDFLRNTAPEQREELLLMTDDLAMSVGENFRHVAAAKAVNARVVQAIMDVVSEQHRPNTYGRNGVTTTTSDVALSMNLNQRA